MKKFLKNHIEKIFDGIFTICSGLVFFFASDEGTRLLLFLFRKDCTEDAISSFQRKWVGWFFLGYAIIAILLIVVKVLTGKKISDLEDIIIELEDKIIKKDEIIERQKELLKNYMLLKQNIDLIFDNHLKSIARSLCFSNNERISLYIVDNDKFVCCSRVSPSPKYKLRGRSSYPLNEGVIGEAWNNGVEFDVRFPDANKDMASYIKYTKEKYGISEKTIRNFTMYPRVILGYRISNHDCSDHNAIVVVESTNKKNADKDRILTVLERNRECLYELIKDFHDFIPALARAEEEDL